MKKIGLFILLGFLGLAIVVGLLMCFSVAGNYPSKTSRAQAEIEILATASEEFKIDLRAYPSIQPGVFFKELYGDNRIQKRYIEARELRLSPAGEILDPWGVRYDLKMQDNQIIITSEGLQEHDRLPWYKRIFDR